MSTRGARSIAWRPEHKWRRLRGRPAPGVNRGAYAGVCALIACRHHRPRVPPLRGRPAGLRTLAAAAMLQPCSRKPSRRASPARLYLDLVFSFVEPSPRASRIHGFVTKSDQVALFPPPVPTEFLTPGQLHTLRTDNDAYHSCGYKAATEAHRSVKRGRPRRAGAVTSPRVPGEYRRLRHRRGKNLSSLCSAI